jgi:hypothetical protein
MFAILLILALCMPSFARQMKIPSVKGKVIDSRTNKPLANVKVKVIFGGKKGSVLSGEAESYEIGKISAISNSKGIFILPEGTVKPGKGKFVGAEVVFTLPGYSQTKLQVANMRAFGGAIGVFFIGMIDAQGEDFNTGFFKSVCHAYKTAKSSKFNRVWKEAFSEAIQLEQTNKNMNNRFEKLHQQ